MKQFDILSFSAWGGLSISFIQAIALMAFIIFSCCWLMNRIKFLFWPAGISLLVFTALRSVSFAGTSVQQKFIVYNIPKLTAIELVRGRKFRFYGNATDPASVNFHLRPSRIMHRTSGEEISLPPSFAFNQKQVLIVDTVYQWKTIEQKTRIDLLVLAGNPKIYIMDLAKTFDIGQIIIDGSVPAWKAAFWKKDCSSSGIACHDVSEKGAFVMSF